PYHFGYVGLDIDNLKGRDGILVKPRLNSNTQFYFIRDCFTSVKKIDCVKVAGIPAYDIFYCEDYKGVSRK
ncbi:MAG: hypothetical protein J6T12_02880, partial [Salinivirgaceae bacterium]|nr:hypothetical protein [Salinivirgaceae bacterium]